MAENKVTVIGIAGGTGCGKTTVVKRLVEALPPRFRGSCSSGFLL